MFLCKLVCDTLGCTVDTGQCLLYILAKTSIKLSYTIFAFSLPTTVRQECSIKSCVSAVMVLLIWRIHLLKHSLLVLCSTMAQSKYWIYIMRWRTVTETKYWPKQQCNGVLWRYNFDGFDNYIKLSVDRVI